MNEIVIEDGLFLVLFIGLSIPLGLYIHKVMTGQKVFLTRLISPLEKLIYKMMGIRDAEEMNPKRYTFSVLAFSAAGLVFLFALQLLQGVLPLNSEKLPGVRWDLAFNTAVSFVTNTNWQAYAGESTMSNLTQSIGLCVQNFVSAGAGIAVLFVLIRGFSQKKQTGIGNFWKDLTRAVLYILLPLSLMLAILLVSQGVVQTLLSHETVTMLQNGASQNVPLGTAASQIAIKQLGTNGGGLSMITNT